MCPRVCLRELHCAHRSFIHRALPTTPPEIYRGRAVVFCDGGPSGIRMIGCPGIGGCPGGDARRGFIDDVIGVNARDNSPAGVELL